KLPLERSERRREAAPFLLQGRYASRNRGKLIFAVPIVLAVHAERLQLLREVRHDRPEVGAEYAVACWTDPLCTQLDDAVVLLLHVGVLAAQLLQLRLRFLLVAYPFGAQRFKRLGRLLELRTSLLQLERHGLFKSWCCLESSQSLAQADQLICQCALVFHQREPSPLLAKKIVQTEQLLTQSGQRRNRRAQRRQLLVNSRDRDQLRGQALSISREIRNLTLDDRYLGEQSLPLLALALRLFPQRSHTPQLRERDRMTRPGFVRAGDRILKTCGRHRQSARDRLRFRHRGAEAGDLGADTPA